MKEPSYTSCSVIFSSLLVVASIAHAYYVEPTGDMIASDNISITTHVSVKDTPTINNDKESPTENEDGSHAAPTDSSFKMSRKTASADTATDGYMQHVEKQDIKDAWRINIASLSSSDAADRFVARIRESGIHATQKYVVVNGKEYWRVSVAGYHSHDEAKAHAPMIKDKLGLNEVWLGKDSG